MQIISGTAQFEVPQQGTIVTVGKFDGLHKGHQKIFAYIKEEAKKRRSKSVVFTFARSPYRRLRSEFEGEILTGQERAKMLEQAGIDYLIECPFTEEVMKMSPEIFVSKILLEQLHAEVIVVGEDFRFGYQRQGDIALLEQLADRYGYQFVALEKETCLGEEISSTRIRNALQEGNIPLVNQLLGHAYSITGEIVHGRKLGQKMGVPTMNQYPDSYKLLPPFGVYATSTWVEGMRYCGVTNIGIRPTVNEGKEAVTVETNLIGYDGDLYGQVLTVEFVDFLRAECRFPSVEALFAQIRKDREHALQKMETELFL